MIKKDVKEIFGRLPVTREELKEFTEKLVKLKEDLDKKSEEVDEKFDMLLQKSEYVIELEESYQQMQDTFKQILELNKQLRNDFIRNNMNLNTKISEINRKIATLEARANEFNHYMYDANYREQISKRSSIS